MEDSDYYDLRKLDDELVLFVPLTHPFRLNYEKRRVVMIKYLIKNFKIGREKRKSITNFFQIFLNLFEFIQILWNFSRERVKKAAWEVLER